MPDPRFVGTALAAFGGVMACAFAPPTTASNTPRMTSYRNPVLPGFHPDPSVVRVGEWFYLVNSSFALFPGVPLHRSRDLVHWEPLGHVLARDSQLPLATAESWSGIWAPTIRYHAGTYYVITTNMAHGGNFFVTAKDPGGPWSEPVWIAGHEGIDPSLFFDDDGKVYLTSTGTPPGIYAAQIDVETGRLLTSPPRLLWSGTGGRYPEGPHLYRIAGRYYLMISEGGTEYGHMVTMARASSPWGPFEPCPRNPILTHRDTTNSQPIQGTGHADLVEDAEGNWWMVLLAFRPQGGYWHHLGRETFLAPVRWDAQEWPVVNDGQPIALDMHVRGPPAHPTPAPLVRDDFEGPLAPAWNFLRNPVRASYSNSEPPGWLTLHGTAVPLDAEKGVSPTFVGRRQEHLRVRMATRIDFSPAREGEEAGLVLYQAPRYRYELGVRSASDGRQVFVRQTVGAYISTVTAAVAAPGKDPLVLEINAEPTQYTFAWGSSPDRLQPIGGAEARLLSTEVAGGFIGTYVGMYAVSQPADANPPPARFDWFDYDPRE
jgi:xylan 1,4-beta-xylosidase